MRNLYNRCDAWLHRVLRRSGYFVIQTAEVVGDVIMLAVLLAAFLILELLDLLFGVPTKT